MEQRYQKFRQSRQEPLRLAIALDGFFQDTDPVRQAAYGDYLRRRLQPAVQRLVEADSTWFLLDLDSGLPCRVRQEDVGPYGEPGEKIPMEPVPKKILVPSIYEEGEPVTVRSHHIDTNHHVNNAQYVEIAREVVPGGTGRIRELRVEYKKAAVLGDVIYPKISREDGQITVLLQDGQGGSYAILWMRAA